MESLKNEHMYTCNEYYNIIKERDQTIEDLESKINDFKATLKDIEANKMDENNYTLITINNALRSNLKLQEKETARVAKEKEDLSKLLEFLTFKKKEGEFEKDLVKQVLEKPNENKFTNSFRHMKNKN
jgi:transcriptional regulator with XRE-family HTH domain